MRRRMLAVLMLVLMVGLTVLPATATATEVDRYSFQGLTATADMYGSDGAYQTSLYVTINQPKRGPAAAYIYYSEWDTDGPPWDDYYFDGVVELPEGTFQIDRDLTTATLTFDQEVTGTHWRCDDSGCYPEDVTFQLTFDLTWAGFGDTFRRVGTTQEWGPGGKFQQRTNGTYRDAEVTGSWDGFMTSGTFDFGYGQLSNVKVGHLYVMN